MVRKGNKAKANKTSGSGIRTVGCDFALENGRHTSSIMIGGLQEEEKKTDAQEIIDWSNLPDNILQHITSLLNFVDHSHLACTCKSWLSVARAMPCGNDLPFRSPFLFLLAGDYKTWYLLDPLHNDKYTIHNSSLLPSPVKILFCKDGWLLMLESDEESIFFFNPLTKVTINLPKLDFARPCTFSFSHTPVSPHCVVFAINAARTGIIYVAFCCRWDEEWNDMMGYDNDTRFISTHANPIFHDGKFYCLGIDGRLGVFDHTEETWSVMRKPEPITSLTHQVYLAESDAELILVRINMAGDSVEICKLDPLTSRWKELDKLKDDRCLFVSKVASIFSTDISLKRRNGVYLGMLQDEEFVFYSCEKRGLLPRGDLDCAKDYSWTSCWIELAPFKHSDEELRWIKSAPVKHSDEKLRSFQPASFKHSDEELRSFESASFKHSDEELKWGIWRSVVPPSIDMASTRVAEEEKASSRPPDPERAPWLVFFAQGKHGKTQTFFSLKQGKSYVRRVPEMRRKSCLMVSQYGWLLMKETATRDCFLLNPTSMEVIHLPPLLTPSYFDHESSNCILSGHPTDPDSVVCFYNVTRPCLMFLHLNQGRLEWCVIQYKLPHQLPWVLDWIIDLVVCNGKVCGISHVCRFITIGFIPYPSIKIHDRHLEMHEKFNIPNLIFWAPSYSQAVVESCGDLYLISTLRSRDDIRSVNRFEVFRIDFSETNVNWVREENIGDRRSVNRFEVFRIDSSETDVNWVQVESIGNRTFFLGAGARAGPAFSCPADESGVEANSIYYVVYQNPCVFRYSLTDKSITRNYLPSRNLTLPWSEARWVLPSLHD